MSVSSILGASACLLTTIADSAQCLPNQYWRVMSSRLIDELLPKLVTLVSTGHEVVV
jgi:hypothetical protein